MLRMAWFESVQDLECLTGLACRDLWRAGFDLDDMDFGVRVNRKLHGEPSNEEREDGELMVPSAGEGRRLLSWLLAAGSGLAYVRLGRWHYYLSYHA